MSGDTMRQDDEPSLRVHVYSWSDFDRDAEVDPPYGCILTAVAVFVLSVLGVVAYLTH